MSRTDDAFAKALARGLAETRRDNTTDEPETTEQIVEQVKRDITDVLVQHTDSVTRGYDRVFRWLVVGWVGMCVLSAIEFVMWLSK